MRRPIHTSRQKNISTINKHDTQARARFLTRNGQALLPKIHAVFGAANPVQRCRHHKIGKVMSYLPKHLKEQTKAALRAGFRLPAAEGMVRLENQAQWLEREHQDAAASLREYTEEMFTLDRLGLPPSLCRCLSPTNLIESPHRGARAVFLRVESVQPCTQQWRFGGQQATARGVYYPEKGLYEGAKLCYCVGAFVVLV